MDTSVAEILEEYSEKFNHPSFIKDDPISIPHQYIKLQDIEISGLWTAILSWGQRKTIINKARELMKLMGDQPHEFILNHTEKDRRSFLDFKHRTFNATDTLYFLDFFQRYYRENSSLEALFSSNISKKDKNTSNGLISFHDEFFHADYAPERTRKHIATPRRNSSCKRLNMFLRWMVRQDQKGVDFGIWKNISTSQLLIPLDVHVDRIARSMGLLERKQTDFKAVLELTDNLKILDPDDPVKYDFALFGLGVLEAGRL